MCGCKINGFKKMAKKHRMSGFGSAASGLLPILAGFVVGKIATKQLTALSNNQNTGNLIKIAGGLFFASKAGFLGGLAEGIALEGATNLIAGPLESAGIGFVTPGNQARWIAGIPDPGTIESGSDLKF